MICLKNVCLTQFVSYYYKTSAYEDNYLSKTLGENIEDKDNDFAVGLPKQIVLKKSHEVNV